MPPLDTSLSVPWLPPRAGEQSPEEQSWLAAARAGEAWALERLYHAYNAPVFALCHRMLGSPDDAVDATQATFVRAFRQLPGFRGDSSVKTWVYRIAVNESISQLRRRREGVELEEDSALAADGAPGVVEQLAVRDALAQVKPDHRAILVLRFWESLSYEEIAGVLGISLAAVKMRLHRARGEFRRFYEDPA